MSYPTALMLLLEWWTYRLFVKPLCFAKTYHKPYFLKKPMCCGDKDCYGQIYVYKHFCSLFSFDPVPQKPVVERVRVNDLSNTAGNLAFSSFIQFHATKIHEP